MGKKKDHREPSIDKLYKKLKELKRKVKRSRRRRHYDKYDKHRDSNSSHSSSRTSEVSCPRTRSHSLTNTPSRTRSPSPARTPSRARNLTRNRTRSRSRSRSVLINEPGRPDHSCEQTLLSPETEEIRNILGSEGIIPEKKGEDLHCSLIKRWSTILQEGLNSEIRDSIRKKYDIPNNCQLLTPPRLNEEVAAAMNDSGLKRDKRISDKQATLAAAVSGIGQVLTNRLSQQNIKEIEILSDASRLLCDIFHSDTVTRRSLILPGLNKDLRDLLENSKVSEYLFGDKLQDKVAACKAVKKSAQELKNTVATKPKQAAKQKFNNYLNYRGPQRPPMPRPSGPKPKMRRTTYQQATSTNRIRRSPQKHQQRRQTRR